MIEEQVRVLDPITCPNPPIKKHTPNSHNLPAWEKRIDDWIRKLEAKLGEFERPLTRIKRIRKELNSLKNKPYQTVRTLDQVLAQPEYAKHNIQGLIIHAATACETMGNFCSDLSGVIDCFVRNSISGGDKKDISMMLAAGIARMATGFLNFPGVAVHKAAGSFFYLLSSFLSMVAIAMEHNDFGIKTGDVYQKGHIELMEFSLPKKISQTFLHAKNKIIDKINNATVGSWPFVRKLINQLKRNNNSKNAMEKSTIYRTSSSYMWNHIHEYKGITRGLLLASYGLFFIANKFAGSLDKYAGDFINKFIKKIFGTVLGRRIAMTITTGIACGVSVPLSPLIIGAAFACAIACGISVVLLLLAKLSVYALGIRATNSRTKNQKLKPN